VKVYKVIFENNNAIAALPVSNLRHNDIGFKPDHETVAWLALECPDEKTALEVADKVVHMVWVYAAA